MNDAEKYLQSLNKKSVWIFTKQETNFDDAFLATRLFNEIPNIEDENIETYFRDHHLDYDIGTDRHRILVIPQLFGLLTKTPFYQKGGHYNKEKVTEIFDLIKSGYSDELNEPIKNTELYNTIKTEQILKIKIHAIIDTANNNSDYHILPVIFIYKVLKELQLKYNINEISKDHLYTYIMTCKSWKQLDKAVEFIKNNSPISKYVNTYKGLSRLETCLKKNINLFNITTNTISINPEYDEYFYNNFILKYDFDELHEQLLRDVDYSYFLYTNQDFNINLITPPEESKIKIIQPKKVISAFIDEEDNESAYLEKVDSISEFNVNEDVANDAYKEAPVLAKRFEVGRKFRVNPLLGKIAIQKAYYCCEKDHTHETFTSNKTKKNYMEAHHLIPVCFQKDIWEKYQINIDCIENLVSLCPTCHKAFHYGTKEVKTQMITKLYEKVIPKYKSINFNILLEEIMDLYNIK